jgi:hypothetical protein
MASAKTLDVESELIEAAGRYYADPKGFVRYAFPWGEPGELEHEEGPDKWQAEFLDGIGAEVKRNMTSAQSFPWRPIRRAVSSGHGIGKSTMVAWLVNWIMVTRPRSVGTITANTFTQLETKTWAAIQRWTKLSIFSEWFEITSRLLYSPEDKATWYCSPQSSKEENSEAFAGQHSKPATSFYCFDEDSAIPDKIHEVAEGGLTDGEPMIFLFGNPTRNNGHFYNACFREGSRWNPTIVDSRDSRFTNKAQIAEWLQDFGEDSDFFLVRVKGRPPNATDAQFIDQRRVQEAQKRQVVVMPDEPLVAGVDFAWGGSDDNVVRFRRGLDARSIRSIRVKGEFTRDPGVMTTRLTDVLNNTYDGQRISMLFLDSAGIAGPIGARLRALGHRNVQEVNFGADSPDVKFRYFRDYMWGQMKDWLLNAAIDDHPELEADLVGPGMRPDPRQRVWLESKEDRKKRGVDSPDDGDALALTFAAKIAPAVNQAQANAYVPMGEFRFGF